MTLASDPRRRVPRTDAVLAEPQIALAVARLGRALVKDAVAVAQNRVRSGEIAPDAVVDTVLDALPATAASLRPVLNATGVLLHTNLGRAALSPAARAALDVAAGTCDVELDLATGARGPRGRGAVDALLAAVPAAAAAHLVNNGAAALALVATALAGAGREIVITRGELVEIGDGFRIPELLEATGARLREVGTTNRVAPADYAAAIGPETAFVLKVHPSNFVVSGFTRSVAIDELAGLGVPVVADIGSGLLAPHPLLPDEPDAPTALRRRGHPRHGVGRQAPRRPAGRAAARRRRPGRAAAPAPPGPRAARRQADARRDGGDPARPGHTRPAALDAAPAALHARADAARGDPAPPRRDAPRRAAAAAVGGGGAPGVTLPSAAVALPEAFAARAARRRAGGAGPARTGPLPARPARPPAGRRRHARRRRPRVQVVGRCRS